MSDGSASHWEWSPLTLDRWLDLERLFGKRGACSGCWCMWWRLTRSEFARSQGEGNRQALRRLVELGEVPGIMGYLDGEPAGWCSIAPREQYPALERSRTLRRVDDAPVWSIVCFFVAKPYRGAGVMEGLIEAAVQHASARGASVVEAYPSDHGDSRVPDPSIYTGIARVFGRMGFVEVARHSRTRPIMRYVIPDSKPMYPGGLNHTSLGLRSRVRRSCQV